VAGVRAVARAVSRGFVAFAQKRPPDGAEVGRLVPVRRLDEVEPTTPRVEELGRVGVVEKEALAKV